VLYWTSTVDLSVTCGLVTMSLRSYFSHDIFILQAATMKEKFRRAVQLSKHGLDVPEELLLFKKNCDWKGVPGETEAVPEVSPVKFIKAAKLDHPVSERKNHEKDSMKPMMGLGVSILEQKTEGTNDDAGISVRQIIPGQKN